MALRFSLDLYIFSFEVPCFYIENLGVYRESRLGTVTFNTTYKEPLLAEQSLWGVKRLAFAVFNVLQYYSLPSVTCATVRNMFYSGDLLSPKGALGQIWVCVFNI